IKPDQTFSYENAPKEIPPWARVDIPNEEDFLDVTLEPGDILCLPAGTWHSVTAIGHSFSLNIAFNPTLFSDFMVGMFKQVMNNNPEWRHSPPPVASYLKTGDTPEPVRRYFKARLQELADFIGSLDPGGALFADTWREQVIKVAPGKPEDSYPRPESPREQQ